MATTMLQYQQVLQTVSGLQCEVQDLLGSGGQGEVYRAILAGKPMALKWYFPHIATSELRQALEALVKNGIPSKEFLWPLELVQANEGDQFGYLMPLRDPSYRSIVDLMMRRIEPEPTFRELAMVGLHLAGSYFQLHIRGLCYRDISFGNVFFDPTNGDVLICDNDNVTINGTIGSGILGTVRFMAPEIVRGEALPSIQTDRFSLAVLLFYLFMFHHPLEGKLEADIHIFDPAAMTRIYGTDPVFIFDPQNNSNRPVRGYQDNALILWPFYPEFLRNLFIRAFTDGLKDPINGRVLENEWRTAMIRLRDSIFYCSHCNAQNFYDIDALRTNGGQPAPCWRCQQKMILPYRIRINDNVIMLNRDTVLYPHHIDWQKKWDVSRSVALVNRHPADAQRWGLKNISDEPWVLTKPDGSKQDVAVGKSVLLEGGFKINFGNTEGEIRY